MSTVYVTRSLAGVLGEFLTEGGLVSIVGCAKKWMHVDGPGVFDKNIGMGSAKPRLVSERF